ASMSFTPICRNMPVRAERKSVKSSTMRKRLVLYSTIWDLHAGDRDIHVLGLVINQSRPWRLVSDTSANRCGMIVTGQCRPERMRRLSIAHKTAGSIQHDRRVFMSRPARSEEHTSELQSREKLVC